MAVKRIVKNRLEKAHVAGETESITNAYLEARLNNRIVISNVDPLSTGEVLNGSIWRNTGTNPDTWNILMNSAWVNMLASSSEHGLLTNIHFNMLTSATSVPTNSALVKYDTSSEISAIAFNSTSSRRYKTNISKIEQATELIQELEGVNFNWKSDGKADIGLIAEDVQQVIPEIVKTKNGVVEGIAYDHLVAVLIQGFKEQQLKIDKILNHLGLDNE